MTTKAEPLTNATPGMEEAGSSGIYNGRAGLSRVDETCRLQVEFLVSVPQ